jgi:hypothetical protein
MTNRTAMKGIFFYFLLSFLLTEASVFAQQQETIATFIIQDARLNDEDVTAFYLDGGGYLVIYKDSDEVLLLANVLSNKNTQSYGRMFNLKHEKRHETQEEYELDVFQFRWSYQNSYDNREGTADVELLKIHKPNGIAFVCTIITEKLDVLRFKGYMEGSLQFGTPR